MIGADDGVELRFPHKSPHNTEPTQAPPGHVVIHDNSTNRAALPANRHSSF